MEAPTCTANEISARIPLPSLRDTFPPGEGFVVLLPVLWAAVVCGGLGRCGHRPLRWGSMGGRGRGAVGEKAPQALLALPLGELARR